MKTRNGFVSNSSSSSYTLILKSDDFKAVTESIDALTRNILEHLQIKDDTFGDDAVKVISWMSGNYSSFENMDFDDKALNAAIKEYLEKHTPLSPTDYLEDDGTVHEDFTYDYLYDCWDNFTEKVKNKGILVSVHS